MVYFLIKSGIKIIFIQQFIYLFFRMDQFKYSDILNNVKLTIYIFTFTISLPFQLCKELIMDVQIISI